MALEPGRVIGGSEHFRRLERLYLGAPVNAFYRPAIEISEGRAEVAVDARRELMHAASAIHGSVLFKLLDDACFFAVNSLVEDVFVLTASFQVYFVRPVIDGRLRGLGRVVHSSRRVYLAEGEVRDAEDRVVTRGSGSFMKSEIRLDEGVGYR